MRKIVERERTEAIFHNPQDEYTKTLISANPPRHPSYRLKRKEQSRTHQPNPAFCYLSRPIRARARAPAPWPE